MNTFEEIKIRKEKSRTSWSTRRTRSESMMNPVWYHVCISRVPKGPYLIELDKSYKLGDFCEEKKHDSKKGKAVRGKREKDLFGLIYLSSAILCFN